MTRGWIGLAVAALVALSGLAEAADMPVRGVGAPVSAAPMRSAPPATVTSVELADPVASPSLVEAVIPEFLRRSGSRAGGPANELNTGDTRARTHLPGGSVAQMLAGRDLYHGNFCGPGNRGDGVAPVDALDAACRRHDACYGSAAQRSCGCDRALRRDALAVAATASFTRDLRARAASVAESTLLMGCTRP